MFAGRDLHVVVVIVSFRPIKKGKQKRKSIRLFACQSFLLSFDVLAHLEWQPFVAPTHLALVAAKSNKNVRASAIWSTFMATTAATGQKFNDFLSLCAFSLAGTNLCSSWKQIN